MTEPTTDPQDTGPYMEEETVDAEATVEVGDLLEIDPEPTPVAEEVTLPAESEEEYVEKEPRGVQTISENLEVPASYKASNYTFSLPSYRLDSFNRLASKADRVDVRDRMDELKDWTKVVRDAVQAYIDHDLYVDRLDDPNSEFEQGVKVNATEPLQIGKVRFKKATGELKGEAAVLKVTSMLGIGDVVTIPLPHSGLKVTIKPPTDTDLIDFYHSTFKEKVELGRHTSGLTLTNVGVVMNNNTFKFIQRHIHSISNPEISARDLGDYLVIHDFHILAWGFASAIYPQGFDYQRACINDINECTHIDKAVLNMSKLLWTDNTALTDVQRNILNASSSTVKLDIDSYKKYQAEHMKMIPREFSVMYQNEATIKFGLRIPTFSDHVKDGLSWTDKINTAVETAMLEEDNPDNRTELLSQYIKTSALRQFSHFIDYIDTGEGTISDRDTIYKVLEVFTGDDEIRTEIIKSIIKFKEDTTISLVGIPSYKCPKCGTDHKTDTALSTGFQKRFTHVIPLDVMHIFFSLITLKTSRIMERDI